MSRTNIGPNEPCMTPNKAANQACCAGAVLQRISLGKPMTEDADRRCCLSANPSGTDLTTLIVKTDESSATEVYAFGILIVGAPF